MYTLKRPAPFSLSDADFIADPAPMLAQMRAVGPLVPIKIPLMGSIWVTTTHSASQTIMKGKDDFFLEARNAGGKGGAAIPWWFPPSLRVLADNMLAKDEPDHKRLRTLVDQAFRRHGVLDMRSGIEDQARKVLAGLKPGDDLVPKFARRLPLLVICELLGLDGEDRAAFERAATPFSNLNSPRQIVRLIWATRGITRLVRRFAAQARTNPRPGLLSELVAAERNGDRLSETEMVSMIFLLLFAGMETTTNLIAGSVWALQNAPDQKTWLLADMPDRREQAVEELTRFVSSVGATKPRFVARDMVVHGVPLAQGDKVMALPVAANYDPAVFENPETLKLDRFPNPHLSFSTGIHFCLGLQLARVEVQAALQVLYEVHPNLTVDRPRYLRRPGHRAIRNLKVNGL